MTTKQQDLQQIKSLIDDYLVNWTGDDKDEDLRKLLYSYIGKIRGKRTMQKHGAKHFSEAGKKGMQKRWHKDEKI